MLPDHVREALTRVGRVLMDQRAARVLVPPRAPEPGFWFGGGNVCAGSDGSLLLCGRYRNGGDSRTGIEAGPRGAELAVLRSTDGGDTFQPALSLLKEDVAPAGEEVLSIEGSCLRRTAAGLELYVGTEKRRDYPDALREHQKQGTGVWSIDVLRADHLAGLASARAVPVLRSDLPARLHVKDPVVTDVGGRVRLLYSCHPFSWASSNTGLAELRDGAAVVEGADLLSRGPVWDVAVCRVTERLPMPAAGVLAGWPPTSLYFYDGAECMSRHGSGDVPKGYSCEEIGGLAAGVDDEFPQVERLSVEAPLFVSPHGTGCSRYVSVFEDEGGYLVTWQQSQPDGSQPLVAHQVLKADVAAALDA